jgi:hypothetical protein
MDTTTLALVVVFAILIIAYTMKRRSRLRSED